MRGLVFATGFTVWVGLLVWAVVVGHWGIVLSLSGGFLLGWMLRGWG